MSEDDRVRPGDGARVVAAGAGAPPAELIGRRTLDGERLIAVFSALVEPIGQALPPTCEVVLHDLSLLPHSVVAAYGGAPRRPGDPGTDLLLEQAVSGFHDVLGQQVRSKDGRSLRSSTMIIRDVFANPVAALCINTDLSGWETVAQIAAGMLGRDLSTSAPDPDRPVAPAAVAGAPPAAGEDVEELARSLIERAIATVGVPVALMKKEHRLEVVRDLKSRGMFLIREAVEMVAQELTVTRFTIYNYLDELSEDGADNTPRAAPRRSRRTEENE